MVFSSDDEKQIDDLEKRIATLENVVLSLCKICLQQQDNAWQDVYEPLGGVYRERGK